MKAFVYTFTDMILVFIVDAQGDPWEALVEDEETVDGLKITVGRDRILCEVPRKVNETVHSHLEYIPVIAALISNGVKSLSPDV
jgi:hypothetical protein